MLGDEVVAAVGNAAALKLADMLRKRPMSTKELLRVLLCSDRVQNGGWVVRAVQPNFMENYSRPIWEDMQQI